MKFINEFKPTVLKYVENYLEQQNNQQNNLFLSPPSPHTILKRFIGTGKMIRGCLLLASYSLFQPTLSEAVLHAASALELFHAALLIHDDIMDESLLRHQEKSVHIYYGTWGKEQGIKNIQRFGENMGLCVGDMAFFWAFDLLSYEAIPSAAKNLFIQILTATGMAQIQDVYYGMSKAAVSFEGILDMYTNKTAGYTFVLPLCVGGLMGNAPPPTLSLFKNLGEHLGIMFQLKDDMLGMFGEQQDIGKPIGDDIRTGKKTPYHYYLQQETSEPEQKKLATIFGNPLCTAEDIRYVQNLCRQYAIDVRMEDELKNYAVKVQGDIDKLELDESSKLIFQELLEFNLTRKK